MEINGMHAILYLFCYRINISLKKIFPVIYYLIIARCYILKCEIISISTVPNLFKQFILIIYLCNLAIYFQNANTCCVISFFSYII